MPAMQLSRCLVARAGPLRATAGPRWIRPARPTASSAPMVRELTASLSGACSVCDHARCNVVDAPLGARLADAQLVCNGSVQP
jgi:hypothetical protein